VSRRIENWPPGLGRPARWVRFRLIERWSVWHRFAGLPVEATDCGIGFSSRVIREEKTWTGIPDELCCEVCLRHYLVAKVPPLGSPGGDPITRRGTLVIRTSQRRRRSNQPSV
jgi:hypothetical protein